MRRALLLSAVLLSACGSPEEIAQRRAAYAAAQQEAEARKMWLKTPEGIKVKTICDYKSRAATEPKRGRGIQDLGLIWDESRLTDRCLDTYRQTGIMPSY